MTGPDGDAMVVENGADVVRMGALEQEGAHGDLLGRLADQAETGEGAQALGGEREQGLLAYEVSAAGSDTSLR